MSAPSNPRGGTRYNKKFLKYIKAFGALGTGSRLFPKKCSTCGREYANFPQYIQRTSPVAHGLEPYKDSLDSIHTMQYRNCRCGSTLSVHLTEEDYPLLESLWEMLGRESKESGRPIREVVMEFREQCNRYLEDQLQSSKE